MEIEEKYLDPENPDFFSAHKAFKKLDLSDEQKEDAVVKRVG